MRLLETEPGVQRIVVLGHHSTTIGGEKTRSYHLDLSDPRAEEGALEILNAETVDTLIHAAFLEAPGPTQSFAHELENVGTMRLVNACRRAGVRKLIAHSRTFLYGAHPTNPNFLSEKHPLRAKSRDSFFREKLAAEAEVLRYGSPGKGRLVTVLRTAPILGPNVDNVVSRYLSLGFVPAILGFDPLWQLLHEADAMLAFKLALLRDAPGVFNIASEGVLPLSAVIRLAGRSRLPLPRRAARATLGALRLGRFFSASRAFPDYLQYLCVADGERAQRRLGFFPRYTTREAVLDFANALHLRDLRLISETSA